MSDLPTNVRHNLILVRDLERFGGDDRDLRRQRDAGELIQVRRGSYMPAHEWNELDGEGRHRARVHAVAANARIEPIFSHFSAAALHGIPVLGSLPVDVHVTIERGTRRRAQSGIRSHSLGLEPYEIDRVDGVLVTSVERTLIDLALTTSFESAVASVDWGLANGFERSLLQMELERMNPPTRAKAAMAALGFADARSGSPGESLSRARMFLLGFPIPELQVPISDDRGRIGIVDFYWRDHNLIGEFDGRAKYVRDDYLQGRTAAEVVLVEKVREDRMRATGAGMIRWNWSLAEDMRELGRLLSSAGLPTQR
ncbi:hypothetical protein [Herbiconiux sp. L3-i23]|uniref:type IV toxin-antitoxin system AbiEi family antitoxin domain-containing protein n=1 Tax=Herbiconiux sp. L3-i23 TaxID=2905871 RepID=UPI0020731DBF|nr:hypothetical protein [Herbiconiux sp. L3-i23]